MVVLGLVLELRSDGRAECTNDFPDFKQVSICTVPYLPDIKTAYQSLRKGGTVRLVPPSQPLKTDRCLKTCTWHYVPSLKKIRPIEFRVLVDSYVQSVGCLGANEVGGDLVGKRKSLRFVMKLYIQQVWPKSVEKTLELCWFICRGVVSLPGNGVWVEW